MQIFYTELNLEQGFDVLDVPTKYDRLVKGRQVSACAGWSFFQTLRGHAIKCWSCGCEADRWVADRGRKQQQQPVLNLYGMRGEQLVLINRDHIIPRSLGGVDDNENLRAACEVCNGGRGNAITEEDLAFRAAHPHLIDKHRLEHGKQKARKAIKLHSNEEEKLRIAAPFKAINEEL